MVSARSGCGRSRLTPVARPAGPAGRSTAGHRPPARHRAGHRPEVTPDMTASRQDTHALQGKKDPRPSMRRNPRPPSPTSLMIPQLGKVRQYLQRSAGSRGDQPGAPSEGSGGARNGALITASGEDRSTRRRRQSPCSKFGDTYESRWFFFQSQFVKGFPHGPEGNDPGSPRGLGMDPRADGEWSRSLHQGLGGRYRLAATTRSRRLRSAIGRCTR